MTSDINDPGMAGRKEGETDYDAFEFRRQRSGLMGMCGTESDGISG